MEPEYSSQILVRMKLACAITFCCVPDLSLRVRSLLCSQDFDLLGGGSSHPAGSFKHHTYPFLFHCCDLLQLDPGHFYHSTRSKGGQKGRMRATRRNSLKKEAACTRKGHSHVYTMCEYAHVASLVQTFSSRRDGHVCVLSERQLRISRSVYPPSFGRTPLTTLWHGGARARNLLCCAGAQWPSKGIVARKLVEMSESLLLVPSSC